MNTIRFKSPIRAVWPMVFCLLTLLWTVCFTTEGFARNQADDFRSDVMALVSFGDRSTGSAGNQEAASFIKKRFKGLGFEKVASHQFEIPVLRHTQSKITFPRLNRSFSIQPIKGNVISPGTVPPDGIEGPVYYVGSGRLSEFNGKDISGSVVLMELDSGKNWLHAASLGAKALIYVDRGPTINTFFQEKLELTPVRFPRFWLPVARAKEMFGDFKNRSDGPLAAEVRLTSDVRWERGVGENIYCLIPGSHNRLADELILVEAFYDSSAWVSGHSPGADEACGIATLLDLARYLKANPPDRSVVLVATSGHAQSLAGMRELMWALKTRSKNLRKYKKELKGIVKKNKRILKTLKDIQSVEQVNLETLDSDSINQLHEALAEQIKTETDRLSRRLVHLRMNRTGERVESEITKLAGERLVLRRIGWRSTLTDLTEEERKHLNRLFPLTRAHHQRVLKDSKQQEKMLKGVTRFRSLVKALDLTAVVSLHLSSHGDGFGAFNQGWLFPLKPQINRVSAYSILDDVLRKSAAAIENSTGSPSIFKDTLRPSRRRAWESYFFDKPPLGGEISALAGYHGLTFVTTHDARPYWGTPYDQPRYVDWDNAVGQSDTVCRMIGLMSGAPVLRREIYPRDGFSTISGRANFLRHGELFADQPAPNSVILAYQGPGRHHVMVDTLGTFRIKGVADKKHVLHKVIIEGYKFDPQTGAVVWAIDKKQTGKPAYRVKMQRRYMETALVMFACRESTLFSLLEPRSFRYMNRIQLLDGKREAKPLRYWWSRVDTWRSTIASVYLEPDTRFKMTLSDSRVKHKLILTNANEDRSQGTGYRVDDWPVVPNTDFRVAGDMWSLIRPRVINLEKHGIYNERIRNLQNEGIEALGIAEKALSEKRYDRFYESAKKSWALASRVYDHVQKTQKDVLFGVLFYIALFVPFAFCMERLLFSYSDIYKRIIAFSAILLLVIAVIYYVHPAFQLAYSPMVVVLAFFIMGLSLIVTLIIFFRFEDEMIMLQSRAHRVHSGEISRWKAFVASFLLGVANLRRRRLRTALTCATLIILTFTIMSFTSVKSMRQHTRLLFHKEAAYKGFLMKNVNWEHLPPEAAGVVSNAFNGRGVVAPRVWLEEADRTRSPIIPVQNDRQSFEARGLLGLSVDEIRVTNLDRILSGGRWFRPAERDVVILPERLAVNLGIDPIHPEGAVVKLWGMPFQVVGVFSGEKFMKAADLDGEPLTPVTFPSETTMAITEVEMEAMESGDDVRNFQSRYQHVNGDLTLIVPYQTVLAAGGRLKSLAVQPTRGMVSSDLARELVDRFGLAIFSGEADGTYLNDAGDTMSYSGVPNIIIPLLISVFIVLNTMISSVYERKREIAVYTSVGLAPSHVSFLFITEALAFAVLSVVMGYLLAQISASLFSDTRLWAGITVNYSSLAGVAAMILVILVVLISVLYPSRVAAQIAIPDVNRSWTMPHPKQNVIELSLPFLVKVGEQLSCGGYLLSHFKGHQDISHGLFSTGEIDIRYACLNAPKFGRPSTESATLDCLNIHSQIWLAPFDFGIMQRVEVQFEPAEEEAGFLEISVKLVRLAGEANAWGRVNKAFMNELRKQLLIWRSLDGTTREAYAELLTAVHAGLDAQRKDDTAGDV